MAGTELALSARGVRMEYRDRSSDTRLVAIETMDLDVADGEFVSLLGPSGCGKSTFLKIVNGLLVATAGEIRLRRNGKGREDAMVFQDAALFPWYSVLDNVAYGLVCAGVSNVEARKRAEPLRIWNAAKKTVVFVTHQIEEAVYLSDCVVVMSSRPGRILADIPIALPRPRALEVKRSAEFTAYAAQIWQLLA